jgi:putative transposase
MCPRFVCLLITLLAPWLRLSRREETWKTAEILILRHQLAVLQGQQPCRPKLNWADRALFAALLGVIPKARRHGLRLLVTPDTILRWHRDIARRRWAARSVPGKAGRPATRRNIKALVLRLARENPEWGYRRIHGELGGLGVKVAASTAWEILRNAGIDLAPCRSGPTWSQFLRSQAQAILACDLFTADLLDGTQAHVLAVIEHATRRIRILGVTLHPTGEWTSQQARNLLMDLGGQAGRVKFMIRGRHLEWQLSDVRPEPYGAGPAGLLIWALPLVRGILSGLAEGTAVGLGRGPAPAGEVPAQHQGGQPAFGGDLLDAAVGVLE